MSPDHPPALPPADPAALKRLALACLACRHAAELQAAAAAVPIAIAVEITIGAVPPAPGARP